MGPKQQNNAMVDKIKALLDTKFEELSKNIDTLQDEIDANHNALHIALEKNRSENHRPKHVPKALKIKRS